MSDVSPHEPPRPPLSLWGLFRDALSEYIHDLPSALLVVSVRLLPFYVLLWVLPIEDDTARAIAETAIAVPCVAALVRMIWDKRVGGVLHVGDAILGASPSATLRLLVTNLFILMVALSVQQISPAFFVAFLLVWTWVTLLADQVVIIEGKMMISAIARSFSIVRSTWKLSLIGLLALLIPEAAKMTLFFTMTETLQREILTRAVTVTALPFTAVYLTLYYERSEPVGLE